MKQQNVVWSVVERTCLFLLQRAKRRETLLQIHSFMIVNAIVDTNVNILAKFITVSASLAVNPSISEPLSIVRYARKVFDKRPHRDDTFLCNSMIKAHVDSRQFFESFTLYNDLRKGSGFLPDNFTFTTLAKSCGSSMAIKEGFQLHNHVVKIGFGFDLYVCTALVEMYAKFGELVMAKKLFDEMTERSLVSWTVLIGGYVKIGDMGNAKILFDQMPEKDSAVFNVMIDGYVKVGDMDSAQSLFDKMPERNVISWTSMIYGYCSNGDVMTARSLFDAMPKRNLFSWNAMIGGYSQNKQPHEALKLFHEMQSNTSFEPDKVTIVSILPAIADLGALELGSWVHQYARMKKFDRAIDVCTALVDMYAKCGEISKAKRVFDQIPNKEEASWNAMINGLAVNGLADEALQTFTEMQHDGVKPNDVTMIGVLSACNHGGLVEEGKRWFKAMHEFGLIQKIEHYGCLVDLLGRAGRLEEAEKLITSMPYKVNGIITSSFLSACANSKDVTRAQKLLRQAQNMEPLNDGNYVMLRNLYAMEKRWSDVEEIKGMMRRNGAKKEAGSSAIEIDSTVSEFIAGGSEHPQWGSIQSMLGKLLIHMRDKGVGYTW
ncbi:pentatricopeptide repeat-containing protein At2g44880 [Mercurialis annua]|uniref:pentatricopeptide repeat-containing protein At2g44880 n=1 Tax=Mercurialis annua TaxID=3986 RepID=UPI00215F82B5|nr:pentatricopeptide repeat-containing protein At2g44880 [Mercurialis annua]